MPCWIIGVGDEYWFDAKVVYMDKNKAEKDCKELNRIFKSDSYCIQEASLESEL